MSDKRLFILRNNETRANAIRYLQHLVIDEQRPMQVLIKEHQTKRSLAQNNLFHRWMTEVSKQHYLQTGVIKSPEVWKMFFKLHFLGMEHHECMGREWDEVRHTSDLGVKEFSEFLNNVDHFCGSELEIALPHPFEYAEAMGRAA